MTSMEVPKQHPFSLYDFIGYFIPGSVFLFLLILFDTGKDGFCAICNFVENLSIACNNSFLHSISTFIFFFAISYVGGHLISILSNFVIEKSYICSYHNYFYYVILDSENKLKIKREGSFLFDILLFYIYFYEWLLIILQKLDVKIWDKEVRERMRNNILSEFRHIKSPDQKIQKILKSSLLAVLNKKIICEEKDSENKEELFVLDRGKKTNFFELFYHYVIEYGSNHLYKVQNYVALYGFMRNMSMVFCILFWFTLFAVFLNAIGIIDLTWPRLNWLLLFVYSFSGFLTMFGLHKYKKRYSLEVLMATAVLSKKNL